MLVIPLNRHFCRVVTPFEWRRHETFRKIIPTQRENRLENQFSIKYYKFYTPFAKHFAI